MNNFKKIKKSRNLKRIKKMLFLSLLSASSLLFIASITSCSLIQKKNENSEKNELKKVNDEDKKTTKISEPIVKENDKKTTKKSEPIESKKPTKVIKTKSKKDRLPITLPTKPIISKPKLNFEIQNRIKIEISSYKFNSDLNGKSDDFGVLKNIDEFNTFLGNFIKSNPSFRPLPQIVLASGVASLTDYAINKYNEDFFKNHDLVFWYSVSGITSNDSIVDSATLKDNKITINATYLSTLENQYFPNKPSATAFESWFNFIAINKNEYKYDKIEINRIDTFEKFKAYSSKDYEGNYSKKDSMEQNKEFNTYINI